MDVMLAMKKAFNKRTPVVLIVKWISWMVFMLSIVRRWTYSMLAAEASVSVPTAAFRRLVCFVAFFATHSVTHCLNGHNSSENSWLAGTPPAGWRQTVQWQKPGLLLGWCGSGRPTVTRSQLSRWNAREQEVEVECGARGRGRRSKSRDDQVCHYYWLTRPNCRNGFTPQATSARATMAESLLCFLFTAF